MATEVNTEDKTDYEKFRRRGLGRRYQNGRFPNVGKDGHEIPGMWSLEVTSGEYYEQSSTSSVGLFHHMNEAQTYYDAYLSALQEGKRNETNQYSHSSCAIKFIPFAPEEPIFHNLYTVETSRTEDGTDSREIESVQAVLYSEAEILKKIETGKDPRMEAIWNDRNLAVYADYSDLARKDGREVISSAEFLPISRDGWGFGPEYDDVEYDSPYETFITFNPDAVVLKRS